MKPASFGWFSSSLPFCLWLVLGVGTSGAEQTFALKEVSAFEQGDDLTRGQAAMCQDKPFSEVKSYPEFKSKKPVYGFVRFAEERDKPNSGLLFHFALDESKGTGTTYDLLYLDQNQDMDLKNDPVLKVASNPPGKATLSWSNIKQQVVYDTAKIPFDCGPEGRQLVEVLPRFTITAYEKEEYKQMTFVRTHARAGDIKIGEKEFRVCLGNDYVIHGRLDAPSTAVLLTRRDNPNNKLFWWWGSDRLNAIHKIDDKFYTLSSTPTGDKLTVRPYEAELGRFEVGAGKRKISKMRVQGSLDSREHAVPLGNPGEGGSLQEEASCLVPVGDYSPSFITVTYDKLRLNISFNYHSDGKRRDRAGRERVYGMTVRKDKPFVLDFANAPEVMFASPAKDARLKRGDTLEVSAVLTDPKHDFMIRGLDDTTRKKEKDEKGNPLGYERDLSLDPKVLVTRLNGEKVAEGVMPFG